LGFLFSHWRALLIGTLDIIIGVFVAVVVSVFVVVAVLVGPLLSSIALAHQLLNSF
jgi:hypothetical protein